MNFIEILQNMNLKEILLVFFTGVGTGATIVLVYLKWKNIRKKIEVNLSYMVPNWSSEIHIYIEAVNSGSQTTTLSSAGLILPDGDRMFLPDAQNMNKMPYKLEPNTNFSIWVKADRLKSNLTNAGYKKDAKLRAYYKDQTGDEFTSKKRSLF
ncbi:MAG: hypothetical protein ACOC5T_01305 [Elusimicrobiota bacterium]